jgi:hypothetical protein
MTKVAVSASVQKSSTKKQKNAQSRPRKGKDGGVVGEAKRKKRRGKLFEPTAIARLIAETFHEDIGLATYSCMARGIFPSFEIASFSSSYQRRSTLKKFKGSMCVPDLVRRTDAYAKFLRINRHMAAHQWADLNLPIVCDRPSTYDGYSRRDKVLILARRYCHWILGDITSEEIFSKCKHSGGASIGVPRQEVNLERKFTPPFTGTLEAIKLFSLYLDFDRALGAGLRDLFGDITYKETTSSRATTVDKDSTKDRFIAVEPTLNMFFQQGIMAVFYDRLRPFVDMTHVQEHHRALAQLASLDGLLATIDWSSASDCVSTDLLRYLLPRKWFDWCDQVRTGFVSVAGSIRPCYMFATMGNATTFPLETLVFLSIGLALQQIHRAPQRVHVIPDVRHSDVSVFGDDCIVPSDMADEYIKLLTSVGFIVNSEKTFTDRKTFFRESCGGDFYHGSPVRPLFIEDPHDVTQNSLSPWLHTVLNHVFEKYILYFGRDEWFKEKRIWTAMATLFRENGIKVLPVPSNYPDDAGFRYFWALDALECLGFPIGSLKGNRFGFTRFSYNQFRYKEDGVVNPLLRYLFALKFPGEAIDEVSALALQRLERRMAWLPPRPCGSSLPHDPPAPAVKQDCKVGRYVVACGWVSNLPTRTALNTG